jgi:hypothetical protein
LKTLFLVKPINPLAIHLPAFPLQQSMDPLVTVTYSDGCYLDYPFSKYGLIVSP